MKLKQIFAVVKEIFAIFAETKNFEIMKKIICILLITICTLSCTNRTDGNIIGAWMSIENDEDEDFSWMNGKTIYTFNIDGTYTKDNHLWIGNKDIPRIASGVWKRDGDILLMKETKSSDKSLLDEEREIVEITDKSLKIRPIGESDLQWSFKRVK